MSEAATLLGREADTPAERRIGGIPIRNLYVMLAFADTLSDELGADACGAIENDAFPLDMLARLLTEKITWIRRRGSPRSYRVRADVGTTPEGSLDLSTTIRGMHLLHNRLAFHVDELQIDTPQNRLLSAGVRALLRVQDIEAGRRDELRRQLSAFSGVSYISNSEALRVEWTKSPGAYSSYREALGLARLAVLASLPDESAHDQHWRKLLDDHARMGELFEKFVRGFLQLEFGARGTVAAPTFRWSEPVNTLLPRMLTDLVIHDRASNRMIVGECKLYKEPLVPSRSAGHLRLRPAHVNQLFGYLAATRDGNPDKSVEGLLIYAQVDQQINQTLMLRDFPVRVRTLDLRQSWPLLRKQLEALWPTPLL